MPTLHVDLALQCFQRSKVGAALYQRELDAVKIWQLVARGVNSPEIRVAFRRYHLFGQSVREPPRRYHRLLRVQIYLPLDVVQPCPVRVARIFCHCVGVRVEVYVELLHIVSGRIGHIPP